MSEQVLGYLTRALLSTEVIMSTCNLADLRATYCTLRYFDFNRNNRNCQVKSNLYTNDLCRFSFSVPLTVNTSIIFYHTIHVCVKYCQTKVKNKSPSYIHGEIWSDEQDLPCCILLCVVEKCLKWFALYLYVKHPVSYSSAGVRIQSSPPTL